MGKSFNLKKIFYIFLIVHLLLWSGIALLRPILPIDASECVYWGSLLDLGTNKHPPLAAWIAHFVHTMTGKCDFAVYFLGQAFIVLGFFYIYKFAKLFLDETKAILSVMILETCYVYSYCTIYDGFNPNFVIAGLFPIIVYNFYKAVNGGKLQYWLIVGIVSGLSLLAKYQSVMLLIPLFCYIIFTKNGRKQLKSYGCYLAGLIALLLFLPHIIWLIKTGMFSLRYFVLSEDKYSDYFNTNWKYLFSPLLFLFRQFLTLLGVFFVYFTAMLVSRSPIKINTNLNDDALFLIYAGLFPVILQALPGLFNGAFMIPVWGFTLLFLFGVLLFYFFPMNINKKVIKYFLFWISLSAIIIATVLSIVYTTFRDISNLLPIKQVTSTIKEKYYEETGKDLKYIGGFIEYSIPIAIYNDDLIPVLNCWKNENPWHKQEEVLKEGIFIIDRSPEDLPIVVKSLFPSANIGNYKIKNFNVTIYNKFGRGKDYTLFYAIISGKN